MGKLNVQGLSERALDFSCTDVLANFLHFFVLLIPHDLWHA
jgi:hypothetical protein